jgi:hypothetical protein
MVYFLLLTIYIMYLLYTHIYIYNNNNLYSIFVIIDYILLFNKKYMNQAEFALFNIRAKIYIYKTTHLRIESSMS